MTQQQKAQKLSVIFLILASLALWGAIGFFWALFFCCTIVMLAMGAYASELQTKQNLAEAQREADEALQKFKHQSEQALNLVAFGEESSAQWRNRHGN